MGNQIKDLIKEIEKDDSKNSTNKVESILGDEDSKPIFDEEEQYQKNQTN